MNTLTNVVTSLGEVVAVIGVIAILLMIRDVFIVRKFK